jgi:hypothetical protein
MFGFDAAIIAALVGSSLTGAVTAAVAWYNRRGSKENTTLGRKHDAIPKIIGCFADVKENFKRYIEASSRSKAKTAAANVDRYLRQLERIWHEHGYLFTERITFTTVEKISTGFEKHYRQVARVKGKPDHPEYQEILDDARSWLAHYESVGQKELNDCFARETGTGKFQLSLLTQLPRLALGAGRTQPSLRQLESGS